MRSVRTTLVLGTATAIAVVLAAAGVALHALVRSDLEAQLDAGLIHSARLLASSMEQGSKKVDGDFHAYEIDEFERADRPWYLELWLDDGSVFFRSPSLGEGNLEGAAGTMDAPVLRFVTLPDGRSGRSLCMKFTPRVDRRKDGTSKAEETPGWQARTMTMVLARGTERVDAMATRMAVLLASVGICAIAASTGLLWWIIRRSLRPVERLAGQIGRIGERDLSARIDESGVPQELQPVVTRLNELLGRLEAAFQRERTMSADVAHELRTPLAGLRSTIDVALARPRESTEYREALGDCLAVARQLQDLVENLLSIARLEAGQVESRPERIFPNEILAAAWKLLGGAAASRRLRVEWALGPEAPVVADASLLGLVIRNVLENAVAHADDGGSVKIETLPAADGMSLRVANSGSALPQDRAEHVFERFWRGDAARGAAGSHHGLGLALVKKTVSVLGGAVGVQSRAGGEFAITVSIPSGRRDAGR